MTVILDKPYNKLTLRVRKLTQTSVSAICLFPHCSKKKTNRYYADAKESSRCLVNGDSMQCLACLARAPEGGRRGTRK